MLVTYSLLTSLSLSLSSLQLGTLSFFLSETGFGTRILQSGEMQKHKCKLCSKSFCNGRALGGHMKSHLVSPTARKKLPDSLYSSSSSSSSLAYALRENPRKSFRVLNPDPDSSLVYDTETDTEPESEADPVKKRGRAEVSKKNKKKRTKSKKQKTSSPEPASSVSDGSREQDLAMCLMMLSRDSRKLEIKPQVVVEEKKLVEKRHFPELRRCLIDLNLPPPQEGEVVSAI